MKNLVSTNWLLNNLNNPNIIILDCSWYLPSENIKGKKEYLKEHIPGSYYFDIDKISDMKSKLPHMLPTSKVFEKKIGHMGIKKSLRYSSVRLVTSCRAYTFIFVINFCWSI